MSKTRTWWGEFLSIRAKIIDQFHDEGRTDEEIFKTLTMDSPTQVFLIRTRNRDLDALVPQRAKSRKKS